MRTSATSSVNVVTPGSSTRRSRSHATAAQNNARGPSPLVHTSASSQPASSSRADANEAYPYVAAISAWCSNRVARRSRYRFRHDGSATPICSAT